jgi:hypothetical protein
VTVAVQTHGFAQLLKLKVVEFDDHTLAAQPDCEICRPVTMLGVATVVMALAVVQKGLRRLPQRSPATLAESQCRLP